MISVQFGVVLLFSALISTGYAIRCFECNSVEHPQCNNLTSNDTNSEFLKDCSDKASEGRTPFCRKVVHVLVSEIENGGDSLTYRSCGWILDDTMTYNEDKCFKQDADHLKKKSCVCFTDACNDSALYTPNNMLISTFAILFSIKYLYVS